jgi:hypothetical protein
MPDLPHVMRTLGVGLDFLSKLSNIDSQILSIGQLAPKLTH